MMTVSLVLVFTAISGDVSRQVEAITTSQLLLNLVFGLGFLISGIIGGILNESEPHKAIALILASFFVIGGFTALNLFIYDEDVWVLLTFQFIPTSMVETSLGFLLGYKLSGNITETTLEENVVSE